MASDLNHLVRHEKLKYGVQMKKILLSSIFALLLIAGCSDNSYVNNPETQGVKSWLQINKISTDNSLEKSYTFSKVINGAKGGELEFSKEKRNFSFEGVLKVYPGAFEGRELISAKVDAKNAYIDFEPSPFTFNVPAKLDFVLEGVDLSGINTEDIQFGYFDADNNFVPAPYDEMSVNAEDGKLLIKGAQIDHFSRYGWTR